MSDAKVPAASEQASVRMWPSSPAAQPPTRAWSSWLLAGGCAAAAGQRYTRGTELHEKTGRLWKVNDVSAAMPINHAEAHSSARL